MALPQQNWLTWDILPKGEWMFKTSFGVVSCNFVAYGMWVAHLIHDGGMLGYLPQQVWGGEKVVPRIPFCLHWKPRNHPPPHEKNQTKPWTQLITRKTKPWDTWILNSSSKKSEIFPCKLVIIQYGHGWQLRPVVVGLFFFFFFNLLIGGEFFWNFSEFF